MKVVQSTSHSDEEVCRRLAAMVAPGQAQQAQQEGQPAPALPAGKVEAGGAGGGGVVQVTAVAAAARELGPGITATDVSAQLAVPLPVASEHLLTAEGAGVLCRDDGPEGLRFFRNFFADLNCFASPSRRGQQVPA